MTECVAKIEKFTMRCFINEANSFIVSRFVNGLRSDIVQEVLLHPHRSVVEAYHKALEIEEYFSSFNLDHVPSNLTVPCFSKPKHGPTLVGSRASSFVTPARSSTTKTTFNKTHNSALSKSRPPSSHIEFHHCHAKGHIASHCPQCTFPLVLIRNVEPNGKFDIYIHEPMILDNNVNLGLDDDFHNPT